MSITAVLFLFLGIRYIFVQITEKQLPLFKNHSHFLMDFEYFYTMGTRAFSSPRTLYEDPKENGTKMILLNQSVFHPYPPPSSLLFRLFAFLPFPWAYMSWSLFVYLLIGISCTLYAAALKKEGKERGVPWFPILLSIGAGPTFLDSSFGNVNALLLLLCVLYGYLFVHNRYMTAGLVLSVASWLKLYPLLLLLTLLFARDRFRLLTGFLTGAVTILLVTLLFIPFPLFGEYFLRIAPAYSHQTLTHVFNQSLTASLLRLATKEDVFFAYSYVLTPNWIRLFSTLFLATGISLVFIIRKRRQTLPPLATIAFLCSLIPLVTPIGWGYTFVLTYPALLVLYFSGATSSWPRTLLYVSCWFAFAIPSYHSIEAIGVPWLLRVLYYSRYTLSALVISIWTAMMLYKRDSSSPALLKKDR